MRPLISTGDPKKSVDISRKAELYETSSGMVTITGGKLTTWRRMAKLAVDRIVEREGREAPCRTHEIPLGHAGGAGRAADGRRRGRGVARAAGGPLRARRGGRAGAGRRGAGAGRRVEPDLPDLVAEAPFAARREQARSLADVLLRRTRLGLLDARTLVRAGARRAGAVARGHGGRAGLGRRRAWTPSWSFGTVAGPEGLVPGRARDASTA